MSKIKQCAYCKTELPMEAEGPMWLWTADQGRHKAKMCSDSCVKWFKYRRAQGKLIGVMKNKHYSQDEIADRMIRMENDWKERGQLPAGPDPVLKHNFEKVTIENVERKSSHGVESVSVVKKETSVNIDKLERKMEQVKSMQNVETPETVPEAVRNVIDAYMENKPTEAVEAVTEAPVKPEAVFDELADIVNSGFKVEPKKNRLTMRIREMTLEGQFVRASVLYEHGQTFVDMEAISAPLGDDLADELQELVDEIKEAMKA